MPSALSWNSMTRAVRLTQEQLPYRAASGVGRGIRYDSRGNIEHKELEREDIPSDKLLSLDRVENWKDQDGQLIHTPYIEVASDFFHALYRPRRIRHQDYSRYSVLIDWIRTETHGSTDMYFKITALPLDEEQLQRIETQEIEYISFKWGESDHEHVAVVAEPQELYSAIRTALRRNTTENGNMKKNQE